MKKVFIELKKWQGNDLSPLLHLTKVQTKGNGGT